MKKRPRLAHLKKHHFIFFRSNNFRSKQVHGVKENVQKGGQGKVKNIFKWLQVLNLKQEQGGGRGEGGVAQSRRGLLVHKISAFCRGKIDEFCWPFAAQRDFSKAGWVLLLLYLKISRYKDGGLFYLYVFYTA